MPMMRDAALAKETAERFISVRRLHSQTCDARKRGGVGIGQQPHASARQFEPKATRRIGHYRTSHETRKSCGRFRRLADSDHHLGECHRIVRMAEETLLPRFIHMACRKPANPACISALTARACARATRSAGHSDGVISAQYSHTASDSQTRAPRCSR